VKKQNTVYSIQDGIQFIQSDFEVCADILTCGRTPQKATMKTIMSYTNVDIFEKNGLRVFQTKFGDH
jgi:hypothetical protein